MAEDSPLILSGGNLAAMSAMEALHPQLYHMTMDINNNLPQIRSSTSNVTEETPTSGETFLQVAEASTSQDQPNSSHFMSRTEEIAHKNTAETEAIAVQNRHDAGGIASQIERNSNETSLQPESLVLQNEPSVNSTAPEFVDIASQQTQDKAARRARRDQLVEEFAERASLSSPLYSDNYETMLTFSQRRERNREKKLLHPKDRSQSLVEGGRVKSKSKQLTAEEKEEAETARRQTLVHSANDIVTSPLKRKYSWMNQPKSMGDGHRTMSKGSEDTTDKTTEKVATSGGEAEMRSAETETTSPAKRRYTVHF